MLVRCGFVKLFAVRGERGKRRARGRFRMTKCCGCTHVERISKIRSDSYTQVGVVVKVSTAFDWLISGLK
jgi:hypothetical protein